MLLKCHLGGGAISTRGVELEGKQEAERPGKRRLGLGCQSTRAQGGWRDWGI